MMEIIVDNCNHKSKRESGRFIKGFSYSLKTQFKQGEHRSSITEFKPGQQPHNKLPVGTLRIRRETNTGSLRAWVKISEPNTWLKRSILVWESLNGPLPKGYVVHHKDRNSLNDASTNLQELSRRDHAEEHREELQLWIKTLKAVK